MTSISDILQQNLNALTLVFLGGYGEFGMNFTGYHFKNKLIAVDCGSKFPPQWMLGVESIIPSTEAVIAEFGGIHSYLVTHAHEDHIGALPYHYRKWPAPIYATSWSLAQISEKFRKANVPIEPAALIRVDPGDVTYNNDFRIEWIPVDHSIPLSCALYISTAAGSVFHSGDFKFDPIRQSGINAIERIGKTGVDLLISDSTNAHIDQKNIAEDHVLDVLRELIISARGKVIVTAFSSHITRLQQVIEVSRSLGKKIIISGRGMMSSIQTAMEHNFINAGVDLIIDEKSYNDFSQKEIVVLASGSQGERRSALYRIALNEHETIRLSADDTVIFSSRIIPGNELAVANMINLFHRTGIRVIHPDTYPGVAVSGHASKHDLLELIEILSPKYYIAGHGDFTQLKANRDLASLSRGCQPTVIPIENGAILTLQNDTITRKPGFANERLYVDSGFGTLTNYETLRMRLKIGEHGLIVVSGILNLANEKAAANICLDVCGVSLGLDPLGEALLKQNLITKVQSFVDDFLKTPEVRDQSMLNDHIRTQLRGYLSSFIGKKPVVLSRLFWIS